MEKHLNMHYPLVNTKRNGTHGTFNLNDPKERQEYFQAKAKKEINDIKKYLKSNTFVSFLLSKKSAGKGTYAQMLLDIFGNDKITHLSIGDLVRQIHQEIHEDITKKEDLISYLEKNYRGFMPVKEALDAFINKTQQKHIPTEFILAILKRKIEKLQNKAILIDGFPRNADQISYSLYFREIMNLRPDPDFFIFLDIPTEAVDIRMKSRRICPKCQTSRNQKFLITKEIVEENGNYYMLCDNKSCSGYKKTKLTTKEGDQAGAKSIETRLQSEGTLIEQANNLQGIDKIALKAFIPTDIAKDNVEECELTTIHNFTTKEGGKIEIKSKPWILSDDDGTKVHSLHAAAAVLCLIYSIHDLLPLNKK